MPLDAICMTALTQELRDRLLGGKIDKIYQPARDEVVFHMRTGSGNVKLLLSANPSHPRPQLTQLNRENPETPPMFCMLLRKHLVGGRLLELSQPPLERLVEFRFETLNELGDRVERRLILECIGRRSNLILLDDEGRITDCMRRVDADLSAQRRVMPGMFYDYPAPQAKQDPLAMEDEALRALLLQAPADYPWDKWLLDTFNGVSPLVARELAFLAGESREELVRQMEKLRTLVRTRAYVPTLLVRDGKAADFSFMTILQYGPGTELRRYESFSALLDEFYAAREAQERVKQKGQDFIKSVSHARDRIARRIGNQERELEATRDRERLRQYGDIITSNLYAMERGETVLRAVDYYDPEGREVEIPLDPLLTPQQNAARYYKEYNKAKTAEQMLQIQLERGRAELEYLDSVLENITLSEGERDLQEIRQELTETGYLRRQKTAAKREKRVNSKPMEFRSTAGLRISVGKNNSQNDRLTTKEALKSDLWLHTQKIHGSHVILHTQGQAPDPESVREAAMLAAWFSQGRESGNVPVDYTPVKFVKKPSGARPGMVIYTTYETMYVTPSEELVKQLRVR